MYSWLGQQRGKRWPPDKKGALDGEADGETAWKLVGTKVVKVERQGKIVVVVLSGVRDRLRKGGTPVRGGAALYI